MVKVKGSHSSDARTKIIDPSRIVFEDTSPERSRIMRAVRQRDTTPELKVRKALTALGCHYRVNMRGLPGSPDIGNRRKKFAVFVHGCFWHQHPGCSRSTTPKKNRRAWLNKFADNELRDARNVRALRRMGYKVLIVWECETASPVIVDRKLKRLLNAVDNRLEDVPFGGGDKSR